MFGPADFRLNDQVAVVTGAVAGIGQVIAETFGSAGAAVVVSDLDADAAAAVAEEIKKHGGTAASVVCNMTKEDGLARLAQQTVEQFGKLTLSVSNAGGGGSKPFDMPMVSALSTSVRVRRTSIRRWVFWSKARRSPKSCAWPSRRKFPGVPTTFALTPTVTSYWLRRENGQVKRYDTEPGATWVRRMTVRFLSLLPIDWLL